MKYSHQIICLHIVCSASFLYAQNSKTNIAVLDLDPTGIAKPDAEFLSDRLRNELFETGKFQVIEREKMNEILTEQGFQQSGCTSVECAVEIGQLLNVGIMTAGNIGKIEDLYSISIRMIDVETGAIVKTATRDFEGKLSEVLTDVIPEIAVELASYQSPTAMPAQDTAADEEVLNQEKDAYSKFAIFLIGGLSTLTYTEDINKEIQEINAYASPDVNDFSGHYLLSLELRYALSLKWQIKLGFVAETMLSPWEASLSEISFLGSPLNLPANMEVERQNRFVNSYIGINYAV